MIKSEPTTRTVPNEDQQQDEKRIVTKPAQKRALLRRRERTMVRGVMM